MIPQTLEEYNQVIGLNSEDIGSRRLLFKKVHKYGKEKGYRLTGFYKLKKKQLKSIFYNKINK